MDCDTARDVLSAALDGEAHAHEIDAARTHRDTCPACTRWHTAIAATHTRVRLQPAPHPPDIATVALTRTRRRAGRLRRLALGTLGAAEVLLATASLLLGYGARSLHDARHLGLFAIVVAVGFLTVAWRPDLAPGAFPVMLAVVAIMVLSGIVELTDGRTTPLAEAHHVLEIAGLVLVARFAGITVPHRADRSTRPPLSTNPRDTDQ